MGSKYVDIRNKFIVTFLAVLLAILPIHTVLFQFFVVKLNFSPLVSLWKEGIVLLILFAIFTWILRINFDKQNRNYRILHYMVVLLTLVSIIFSLLLIDWRRLALGLRFQLFWFWFLVYIFLWIRIELKNFNKEFLEFSAKLLVRALFAGFILSLIFSCLQLFLGAGTVQNWLGYGEEVVGLGSEFVFNQPNYHLIDGGGWNTNFRLNAGFSSPNHFAAYLLFTLPFFALAFFKNYSPNPKASTTKPASNSKPDVLDLDPTISTGVLLPNKLMHEFLFSALKINKRWVWLAFFIINLILILLTFSRFSYLALFVIALVVCVLFVYQKYTHKIKVTIGKVNISLNLFKNIILILVFCIPFLVMNFVFTTSTLSLNRYLPSFLVKPSSTDWHQQHTAAAWRAITGDYEPNYSVKTNYYWLGYGLGSTDPTAKYLPLESNSLYLIGVGKDDEKYFPRKIDRPLALTPENWYLGWWLQGGLTSLLLFLGALIVLLEPIQNIFSKKLNKQTSSLFLIALGLSFASILIGALFLDIFDSQQFSLLLAPFFAFYLLLSEFFVRNES